MTRSEAITAQLELLPEPYRSEALENREKFPLSDFALQQAPQIRHPHQAINWGFHHSLTAQGARYWMDAAVKFDYHYFNRQDAAQP